MQKNHTMSIRVNDVELKEIKKAAQLKDYSSYSEFVRMTILKEVRRINDTSIKDEFNGTNN